MLVTPLITRLYPSVQLGIYGLALAFVGVAAPVAGLRFELRNVQGQSAARVPVSYRGSVPDLFRTGREVVVEGTLRDGTFVAKPGTLSTKCPSKYTPAKSKSSY